MGSDLGTPMVRNESDPTSDHPATGVSLAQGLILEDKGDKGLIAGLGVVAVMYRPPEVKP